MAFQPIDVSRTDATTPTQYPRALPNEGTWLRTPTSGGEMLRIDPSHRQVPELVRWPQRLSRETFHLAAYPLMLLSRRLEQRMVELYQKGYVKGTVTISIGNEATTIGAAMPLRRAATWSRCCIATSAPICSWGQRPISCSATTWPMPKVRPRAARAMSITATPHEGVSP